MKKFKNLNIIQNALFDPKNEAILHFWATLTLFHGRNKENPLTY